MCKTNLFEITETPSEKGASIKISNFRQPQNAYLVLTVKINLPLPYSPVTLFRTQEGGLTVNTVKRNNFSVNHNGSKLTVNRKMAKLLTVRHPHTALHATFSAFKKEEFDKHFCFIKHVIR